MTEQSVPRAPRKRGAATTQGELHLRPKTHGGARDGAGRKKKPNKHDSAHRTRPEVRAYHPAHVVMRVRKDVPRLRKGRTYRAIRRALSKTIGTELFRVCHLSIQANHLHFIVEAANRQALARGMQRLNILTARALNRELRAFVRRLGDAPLAARCAAVHAALSRTRGEVPRRCADAI